MIPITEHSSCCPQERAIQNHRIKLRKRERENRQAVREWCKGKLCTCGCGRPANTAHHTSDDLYKDETAYLDLANCDPYYSNCHRMHHAGWERCPVCRGWMRRGREKCAKCSGWTKHPFHTPFLRQKNRCEWRERDQKCRSPRNFSNAKCDRAPADQPGCDLFMEHQRNLSAKIRKSDDELMAELSAGVQKIFADAVKDTPLQRVETEKVSPLDQTTCFENCCVTQHNTTSTVLSLRKEGRKEKSAGLEAVGGV